MNKKDPILICFGTRPEWLKVKPLIDIMNKKDYKLLFTGQHEDLLADIRVDFRVNIEESFRYTRLDSIIMGCMEYFPNYNFSGVLVQGDTASAFACALAAFHRGIKVYYLEAGLRSYDLENPYPEEGYRQMIARLADINFAPTQLSAENLDAETNLHHVFQTILNIYVLRNQKIYYYYQIQLQMKIQTGNIKQICTGKRIGLEKKVLKTMNHFFITIQNYKKKKNEKI